MLLVQLKQWNEHVEMTDDMMTEAQVALRA